MRVRGAAAERQHRATCAFPLVAAGLRAAAQERVGAQSQGGGGLPARQLQRIVQDPRIAPVQRPQSSKVAGPLAQGALHRSGKVARTAAGRRGQVPRPAQVPAAPHHLGRRGDQLLLQGEVTQRPAGLVLAQPVPQSPREARTGRSHRTDHHSGLQLVQEPPPEGQSR